MIMVMAYPLAIFGRSLFASEDFCVFLFEKLINKFRFGKDIFTTIKQQQVSSILIFNYFRGQHFF